MRGLSGKAYPSRWTITSSNPPIKMFAPTTIVELGALMTDLHRQDSRPHARHR
jgi:hypothetical protein